MLDAWDWKDLTTTDNDYTGVYIDDLKIIKGHPVSIL
jgi:hypothetical protein